MEDGEKNILSHVFLHAVACSTPEEGVAHVLDILFSVFRSRHSFSQSLKDSDPSASRKAFHETVINAFFDAYDLHAADQSFIVPFSVLQWTQLAFALCSKIQNAFAASLYPSSVPDASKVFPFGEKNTSWILSALPSGQETLPLRSLSEGALGSPQNSAVRRLSSRMNSLRLSSSASFGDFAKALNRPDLAVPPSITPAEMYATSILEMYVKCFREMFICAITLMRKILDPYLVPGLLLDATPKEKDTLSESATVKLFITETIQFLEECAVEPSLRVNILNQIFHYIDASVFDLFMTHAELNTVDCGLKIKLIYSETDEIVRRHGIYVPCMKTLEHIRDAGTWQVIAKEIASDPDAVKELFSSLNYAQICRMLELFAQLCPDGEVTQALLDTANSNITPDMTVQLDPFSWAPPLINKTN